MRILTIILLVMLTGSTGAQINFFKLFSDTGDDSGEGIVQLEDSSYVITGASSSFMGAGSQAFLLKIDSLGNYKWSLDYGGLESDGGRRVMHKQGMGFYIAGYTNSMGAGGFDCYLVKTDENGGLIWEKSYGGTGWERVHDAAMTDDDGVIMVGETSSNPTENQDMYMVRTNDEGDIVWSTTMGGTEEDMWTGILRYDDTTYYASGYSYIEDSSYFKGIVSKFHEDGTVYWIDTLGEWGNYKFYDLCFNHDSTEVVLAGEMFGPQSTGSDQYFHRIKLDGTYVHHNQLVTSGSQRCRQITQYDDVDGYYGAYSYDSNWSFDDGEDVALAQYNDFLFWLANPVVVSYPLPDYGNDIIRTSDGGAILVGKTNSEGIGLNHIYVAKLGPGNAYPDFNSPHQVGQLVTIEELFDVGELAIYPNPANDFISIETSLEETIELTVVNNLGQPVLSSIPVMGNSQVNVTGLANGLYYLEFELNGLKSVRRVLISR